MVHCTWCVHSVPAPCSHPSTRSACTHTPWHLRWPQRTISVLRTHFSVLLTPFSVLLTLFSVLLTSFSVLRTICSLLLTPFSVLFTQAPIAIATCLETLSDGRASGSSRKRKQEVWDVVIHYIKLNLVIAVSLM